MTDLVTFGETMLRLSPPGDAPIETADSFRVHAAGAESNVAVAAARLGLETVWLSKLPDSAPGRRVTGALARHGVEPAVVWAEEGRQGTYYFESGDQPRGSRVTYDRNGTAIQTATSTELPTHHVEEASAVHTTGITPALSATLAETTADLLSLAQKANATTTFDLNYRSKLWSPTDAKETVTDLFSTVDVLFVAARDAKAVLDQSGPADEIARDLADAHEFESVVVTQGATGSVALHDDEITEQPVFPASDAHPVGTGDAFVGGYLAKWLAGEPVADALEYGAATAALKRTLPGDLAVITPADVERVRSNADTDILR